MCALEDPTGTLTGTTWTCQHIFKDLLYELPRVYTVCQAASRLLEETISPDLSRQYIKLDDREVEVQDFAMRDG